MYIYIYVYIYIHLTLATFFSIWLIIWNVADDKRNFTVHLKLRFLLDFSLQKDW